MMKKITLLFSFLIFMSFNSFAQLNISVDNPDGTGWNAYVNAFNISDGSFAFGFSYDLTKQTTEFDGSGVTLKPNYGIWVDECANADWFDNPGCPNPSNPNKNIEALSYLQVDRTANPEFFNQEVVFSGSVSSFDLDAAYTVKAFIAVFPTDFSQSVRYETADITSAGTFSVTRPAAEIDAGFTEQFFQYGFIVFGPPADPANEATLGSAVFQGPSLSTSDFKISELSVYPNPAIDFWNLKSTALIKKVQLFDILGKNVQSLTPNSSDVKISTSGLINGIYFAKISSEAGSKSIKLIKN